MYKKIGLVLLVMALVIMPCFAADIHDYEIPNGFEVESEYWASNGEYGIGIYEYEDSDFTEFFTNTTDTTVFTADNITNYTGDVGVGCDEIVLIDGEKFLIESYYNTKDLSKLQDCYDNLLEFNKLNNLKPIEV